MFADQLNELKKRKLSHILCDNTEIDKIQKDVF
jgi:hypothetical protein